MWANATVQCVRVERDRGGADSPCDRLNARSDRQRPAGTGRQPEARRGAVPERDDTGCRPTVVRTSAASRSIVRRPGRPGRLRGFPVTSLRNVVASTGTSDRLPAAIGDQRHRSAYPTDAKSVLGQTGRSYGSDDDVYRRNMQPGPRLGVSRTGRLRQRYAPSRRD